MGRSAAEREPRLALRRVLTVRGLTRRKARRRSSGLVEEVFSANGSQSRQRGVACMHSY